MINFKNLGKALKRTRIPVYWFRTEKYSYLFTGYWGIRTTKLLHLEKGIFTTLINMFQAIPEVSKGYEINVFDGIKQIEEQRINSFVELIEKISGDEIVCTDLMIKTDIRDIVILKAPKNYIHIDKLFMDFIDITPETKLYGKGPNNAIYAQNGEEIAMLLPVRFDNISEYLKPIEEKKYEKA